LDRFWGTAGRFQVYKTVLAVSLDRCSRIWGVAELDEYIEHRETHVHLFHTLDARRKRQIICQFVERDVGTGPETVLTKLLKHGFADSGIIFDLGQEERQLAQDRVNWDLALLDKAEQLPV